MLLSSRWQNTTPPAQPTTTLHGVPSLVWLCLQCISEHPDQIQLPIKLAYRPAQPPPSNSIHLLAAAIEGDASDTESINSENVDLSALDPHMWATVVQAFDHIPAELRIFVISLNDLSLPLLQNIPNKDTFSLVTVLELPGCPGLTDSTIVDLKFLSSLAALDASKTEISVHGILTFARTLQANDATDSTRWLNGPWSLRVLRLKYCNKINNQIYEVIPSFPLLCVVDLRGTNCDPQRPSSKQVFFPHSNPAFFSSNLCASLNAIQRFEKDVSMFTAPEEYQFTMRIKNLCHPRVAAAITKGGGKSGKIREPLQHWKQDSLNMAPTPHPRKRRRLSGGIELSSSSGSESENDMSFDVYPSEIPRVVRKISDLHWYDADRQRQNSYSAMSLENGIRGEDLMLFRVPKPLFTLDDELEHILRKEAERTEMQRIRNAPKTYSASQMGTAHKRFAAVQSMAMLALSRRKSTVAQSINPPEQSHKPNANSEVFGSPRTPVEARLLKPISSLRTPEFTTEILHRNVHTDASCEEQLTGKSTSRLKSSTPTNKLRNKTPLTLPSLKLDSALKRGELQEIGRDKRASDPPFEARTPLSTTPRAVTRKNAKKGQEMKSGFDWTAWASKNKSS